MWRRMMSLPAGKSTAGACLEHICVPWMIQIGASWHSLAGPFFPGSGWARGASCHALLRLSKGRCDGDDLKMDDNEMP
eukprot:4378939-Karenia_brevis.AAC.1